MGYTKKHVSSIQNIVHNESISHVADIIIESIEKNNKILICGNGGSASDSNHIAAEFVGQFEKERKPINALSLSSNIALITAIGNDFGFEYLLQ